MSWVSPRNSNALPNIRRRGEGEEMAERETGTVKWFNATNGIKAAMYSSTIARSRPRGIGR
jgi:hypothetical protein